MFRLELGLVVSFRFRVRIRFWGQGVVLVEVVKVRV